MEALTKTIPRAIEVAKESIKHYLRWKEVDCGNCEKKVKVDPCVYPHMDDRRPWCTECYIELHGITIDGEEEIVSTP